MRFPSATPARARKTRRLGAACLVALSAALASCGGGTQSTPFVPDRVLAFGDEASVIDTAGRKYTVNALSATTGAIDCATHVLWTQVVATGRYGLVFPECNPNNVVNPTSRIRAQPGARAAGLAAQIDAQIAAGGFTNRDLSLVMIGANDVTDALALFPASGVNQLVAQMTAAGRQLGQQVNRMADLGSRVVISTVIDITSSPYAATQPNAGVLVDCPREVGETDRNVPLATCLVDRFNAAMRTTIYNDGRRIGLVLGDVMVRNYVQIPALGGFVNAVSAACSPIAPLPTCTTATLSAVDAGAFTWLWAADTQLSPGGHAQLGALASSRAGTNPF